MPSSVLVEKADESKHQLLATLGRQAFLDAFAAYSKESDMNDYLNQAFHPELIRSQLADYRVTYFIAYVNHEPAGYAKLKRNSTVPELEGKNVIQLERIYALGRFLNRGVGKILMENCMRVARDENFQAIWLGVWQKNARAIQFYEKWGFKKIGFKQFVIGGEVNDDFVMALELSVK
jgi:diamine N-acetyltransferase